jgi:hypothetical protein
MTTQIKNRKSPIVHHEQKSEKMLVGMDVSIPTYFDSG